MLTRAHKRTPFKAYGECPDMLGFATYDQDRTAKVRLCHIARHPRKAMLKSDTELVADLLTVLRKFTIGEVQRIGRIFVRNQAETTEPMKRPDARDEHTSVPLLGGTGRPIPKEQMDRITQFRETRT